MKGVGRRHRGILLAAGLALLSAATMCLDADRTRRGEATIGQDHENTVKDIDGNVYHTVTIGAQVWMVENLRVTRYRDGTAIQCVSCEEKWSQLNTGACCVPDHDDSSDKRSFGLLYNFHAVNDERGLCPEGWHVPTAEEWHALIDCLGGVEVAGGRMKDTGSGLWRVAVPGSNNESGFSAIPAGGRGRFGSPADVGDYATWWSSTSHDATFAWHWGLYPDSNGIRFNPGHKSSGFSVRCIKD